MQFLKHKLAVDGKYKIFIVAVVALFAVNLWMQPAWSAPSFNNSNIQNDTNDLVEIFIQGQPEGIQIQAHLQEGGINGILDSLEFDPNWACDNQDNNTQFQNDLVTITLNEGAGAVEATLTSEQHEVVLGCHAWQN
jgi:hypothetical protein